MHVRKGAVARRVAPGGAELPELLRLIQSSFAYMDGRIDPPSSMHHLTLEAISEHCQTGEVWALGTPPVACMFLTVNPDFLYIGKLAVAKEQRGSGFGRALVDLAAARARSLGLPMLQLQTRVELTENHAAFARMGFEKVGQTAHAGYDRPTSITMRKMVGT